MITVVDPHVHLIALADGEYGWLQPSNPPFWPDKSIIARSFSPADLTLSAPLALHAFVHVEAGFDNAHHTPLTTAAVDAIFDHGERQAKGGPMAGP